MSKNLIRRDTYDSPKVRVVDIKPIQCIATSTTQTPGGYINGFDEFVEG